MEKLEKLSDKEDYFRSEIATQPLNQTIGNSFSLIGYVNKLDHL